MDRQALLDRAGNRGVNPLVYWLVRAVLQPFFHIYFRVSRIGREHIPQSGAVIFAANHRSFLDPFIIGTMVRRPIYYVAKKELFSHRITAWFLNSLGAFPIDRGHGDSGAMETARTILERGDCVLIFPEGTRIRPGGLASPKSGVGRLALQTGAPVVPIAVIGTEAVRRGWRVRPHKVRVRAGRPITFPTVDAPSHELATAVTSRIWPCVMLQWEWLGGLPPIRRVVVVGAGAWGTSIATALRRTGLEVSLGCRTAAQAADIRAAGVNERYLPGMQLPDGLAVVGSDELDLPTADLVVLAVPSATVPAVVARHAASIRARAGVLVLSKGLVTADGCTPVEHVAARVGTTSVACLAGPAHAADALDNGASVVLASADASFASQLGELLSKAGFDVSKTSDVIGVELAATAKNAAALAAATAAGAGPNAAGAAAGKVFAEVDAYARLRGARPETFAGLAGAGDLVGTVLASGSRNRRAGELLADGLPPAEIELLLGQTAESLRVLPVLSAALRAQDVDAPVVHGLAAVVEGHARAAEWAAALTTPVAAGQRRAA